MAPRVATTSGMSRSSASHSCTCVNARFTMARPVFGTGSPSGSTVAMVNSTTNAGNRSSRLSISSYARADVGTGRATSRNGNDLIAG